LNSLSKSKILPSSLSGKTSFLVLLVFKGGGLWSLYLRLVFSDWRLRLFRVPLLKGVRGEGRVLGRDFLLLGSLLGLGRFEGGERIDVAFVGC